MKVGEALNFEVYCDESRQDLFCNKESISSNNRYICIGGIWVEDIAREKIKNEIKLLQEKYKLYSEFKWKTVSPSKYGFYDELIELFFKYSAQELRFRCVIIDSLEIDMETYNQNDSELGFYKFYYQLLNYWIVGNNTYRIYTDYKVNKKNDRLIELRQVLNNSSFYSNVKLIQAINSKESLMLQLEDVIMGVVAYKYNFGTNGNSKAKIDLISKFESRLGTKIESYSNNKKVNIFKMSLRRKKF